MFHKGRKRRQKRIRVKIKGTAEIPRLNIFRSNRFIYAQLIDDVKGETLASATDNKNSKPGTPDSAFKVGEELAAKAKKLKIEKIVFDRSGYKYHGKIQALADGARKGGLQF